MEEWSGNSDDLEAYLTGQLKPYIAISSASLSTGTFAAVSAALGAAVNAVTPAVRTPRKVDVVIATTPFRVPLACGELRFTATGETIHACVADLIFIDVNKLLTYPPPLQVAAILEELVHVLLNIADEDLTTLVVGYLYDEIRVVDGRYTLPFDPTLPDTLSDLL